MTTVAILRVVMTILLSQGTGQMSMEGHKYFVGPNAVAHCVSEQAVVESRFSGNSNVEVRAFCSSH